MCSGRKPQEVPPAGPPRAPHLCPGVRCAAAERSPGRSPGWGRRWHAGCPGWMPEVVPPRDTAHPNNGHCHTRLMDIAIRGPTIRQLRTEPVVAPHWVPSRASAALARPGPREPWGGEESVTGYPGQPMFKLAAEPGVNPGVGSRRPSGARGGPARGPQLGGGRSGFMFEVKTRSVSVQPTPQQCWGGVGTIYSRGGRP